MEQSKPPLPCDEKAFIKYPKIENFSNFAKPESFDGLAVSISEKLDGANLGMFVPYEGDPSFFSRNGLNAEGLFEFKEDVDQLRGLINAVRKTMKYLFCNVPKGKERECGMYFWGEYFGSNINRRIKYFGKKGQFRFYDVQIVDAYGESIDMLDPLTFKAVCNAIVEQDVDVSSLFLDSMVFSLSDITKNYADFDEFVKRVCPLPSVSGFSNDNREGYVITIFEPVEGKIVSRWKIKDPSFAEKKLPSKEPKDVVSAQASQLHETYLTYFNDNRVIGILSKTPERKRIDLLVKMLIKDAREDFDKDYAQEIETLETDQRKFVYKLKSEPFLILKKVLMGEKK